MLQKSKISKTKTSPEKLVALAHQSGLLLMAVAATLGMVELPEHLNGKITVSTQPVFSFANESGAEGGNTLRREREEAGPHYVSYSVAQRTPGRMGRI